MRKFLHVYILIMNMIMLKPKSNTISLLKALPWISIGIKTSFSVAFEAVALAPHLSSDLDPH